MIRQIGQAHLDDIDSIISLYRAKSKAPLPENYEEQLKTGVSNDKVSIYGAYSQEDILKGIAIFSKEIHLIRLIFADGDSDIEKELLQALFDRTKTQFPFLIAMGQWITEDHTKNLTALGFVQYPRAKMSLQREHVESLIEPALSENMQFVTYTTSAREIVADLGFKSHDGNVDQIMLPTLFGSLEVYLRGLDTIATGQYGEFREGLSWILQLNTIPIGYCTITIQGGDTGYITDIGILPRYRGKGLGKYILVHTLKNLIESDSAITKIDLDVTLSNPALNLYKSLGFEKEQDWSIFTWHQKKP